MHVNESNMVDVRPSSVRLNKERERELRHIGVKFQRIQNLEHCEVNSVPLFIKFFFLNNSENNLKARLSS